jgi:hypothetical protein
MPPEENNLPEEDEPAASPPDEQFWKRYSRRHELPISSLVSFAAHGLAIGALLLAAFVIKDRLGQGDGPIDVMGLDDPGGGGGSPEGDANSGDKATNQPQEAAPQKPETSTPAPPKPAEDIKTPTPVPMTLPEVKTQTDTGERLMQEQEKSSQDINQNLARFKEQLDESYQRPSKGGGGTGSGGGEGSGVGRGRGPGTGTGSGGGGGPMTKRQKRAARWNLHLGTNTTDEHVRRLAALGAIVVFPHNGGTYVIRDLTKRPAPGQMEDVRQINRIHWVDSEPEVAMDIARYLAVPFPPPPQYAVFLPQSLEEHMAELEHEYRGRSEDQLRLDEKFDFEIVPRGNGYEVIASPQQR